MNRTAETVLVTNNALVWFASHGYQIRAISGKLTGLVRNKVKEPNTIDGTSDRSIMFALEETQPCLLALIEKPNKMVLPNLTKV
jgi:hypothetical protein